jgi:hypothetical protein
MNNLFIQENFVNETEGYRSGETDVYEIFTDSKGELFKSLQKKRGRCSGKMYIDDQAGKPKQIGWIFSKRVKYTDCNDTFLQSTWVTVCDKPNDVIVTKHYHNFN